MEITSKRDTEESDIKELVLTNVKLVRKGNLENEVKTLSFQFYSKMLGTTVSVEAKDRL